MKRIGLLVLCAIFVQTFVTTALAHPTKEAYIERAISRAVQEFGEPSVLKRMVLLEEAAEKRWDRIDAAWQEAHPVETSQPTVVPDAEVAGSPAPLCGSSCIACESGWNPQAVSPAGYWGLYQFDRGTWEAHGGDPSRYGVASAGEQHAVAARIQYDAWPNC